MAYKDFALALDHLEQDCMERKFAYDNKLGFLTLSPMHLGTGLKLVVTLDLHGIDVDLLGQICGDNYLEYEVVEGLYKIRNKRCFGLTERAILENVMHGLKQILQLMSNSDDEEEND